MGERLRQNPFSWGELPNIGSLNRYHLLSWDTVSIDNFNDLDKYY